MRLGIRIAAGTDAGAGVPHGTNALELALLTEIGMTPMQAIQAATSTAAEVLDMADMVGSLKKGFMADMLILNKNPLEDISILQNKENIKTIIKNGIIIVERNLPGKNEDV